MAGRSLACFAQGQPMQIQQFAARFGHFFWVGMNEFVIDHEKARIETP